MSRKKADKSVYEGFGKRIAEATEKRGQNKRLATAVDVSSETVRVWRKGQSLPDVQQLIAISRHINKSIDWLLTGEENKTNCPICNSDKNIKDLCEKVKILIDSKTHWGDSLQANINSFKVGYDNDKKLKEVQKDMRYHVEQTIRWELEKDRILRPKK